jgi:hypothetical protein
MNSIENSLISLILDSGKIIDKEGDEFIRWGRAKSRKYSEK